jgi:hypothetical protein
MIRWVGHRASIREGRGITGALTGRPEFKKPLGRPWFKWVINIKKDIRGIRTEVAKWIRLNQNTVQWRSFVNTVMNLRVPEESGKFLTG